MAACVMPGLERVRDGLGHGRAALRIRCVQADCVRIAFARQHGIGAGKQRDIEHAGAMDHWLHGECHRAVITFDHDRNALSDEFGGARNANRGRRFVVSRQNLNRSSKYAALFVDRCSHGLNRLQHVLALWPHPPRKRNDDPHFNGYGLCVRE